VGDAGSLVDNKARTRKARATTPKCCGRGDPHTALAIVFYLLDALAVTATVYKEELMNLDTARAKRSTDNRERADTTRRRATVGGIILVVASMAVALMLLYLVFIPPSAPDSGRLGEGDPAQVAK
jgi:hypothetical protein